MELFSCHVIAGGVVEGGDGDHVLPGGPHVLERFSYLAVPPFGALCHLGVPGARLGRGSKGCILE